MFDHIGLTGLGFAACFAAACVAMIVAITVPVVLVDRRNCGYASRQYDRPTRWDLWAGCYIRSGDRYIGLDKYIAISEDR